MHEMYVRPSGLAASSEGDDVRVLLMTTGW